MGLRCGTEVQPFSSRQPGARLPKRDSRKVDRSAKLQRHRSRSQRSPGRSRATGRTRRSTSWRPWRCGRGQAVDHRPAIGGVLDDAGPGADDARMRAPWGTARRGASRYCAQVGLEGFSASDPIPPAQPFVRATAIGEIAAQRLPAVEAVAVDAAHRHQRQRLGHDHLGPRRRDRHLGRRAWPRARRLRPGRDRPAGRRRNRPPSVLTPLTLPPASSKPVTAVSAGSGRQGRAAPRHRPARCGADWHGRRKRKRAPPTTLSPASGAISRTCRGVEPFGGNPCARVFRSRA